MKRILLAFLLVLTVAGWAYADLWRPKGSISLGTGLGLGGGGFGYLIDTFTSGTVSSACTPGPGQRAEVKNTGTKASVTGGALVYTGFTADDDPSVSFTPVAPGTLTTYSLSATHAHSIIYPNINNGTVRLTWGPVWGQFWANVQGQGTFNLAPATVATYRHAIAVSGYDAFLFVNEELQGIMPYSPATIALTSFWSGNAITYPQSFQYCRIYNPHWLPSPSFSQGFTQTDTTTSAISSSWFDSSGNLYAGIGNSLYKSTDGVTFGSPLKTFNSATTKFLCVFVDSRDYIYCSVDGQVAADKGLFKSTNGTTWNRVVDLSAYNNGIGIWGIGEDSTGKVYASTYGSKAIIYVSDTSGANFTVANDLSASYTHCHNLCIDPTNDNVYVTLGDPGSAAIAKYDASGASWSVLTPAGKPQYLGCIATPTCRLFGFDGTGNGSIWRTTDDSTFTQVWGPDLGDAGTGNVINNYWMRKDPVTGYIYAGFASGNAFSGRSKILVSIDDGLTWLTYKRWVKTYSGDGTQYASNIYYSGSLLTADDGATYLTADDGSTILTGSSSGIGSLAVSFISNSVFQPGLILNLASTVPSSDGYGQIESREVKYDSSGSGTAMTTVSGTPYVVGGNLIFTAAGLVIADPGKADSIIKCTFTTPNSGAGSNAGYIVFRYTNANNYWAVKITPNSGTNDFQLVQVASGTPTVMAQDSAAWAASTEYTVHISMNGNYYVVDYWPGFITASGTKELTYTDAGNFNLTATKVGLMDDGTSNFAFGGGFGGLVVYPRSPYSRLTNSGTFQ